MPKLLVQYGKNGPLRYLSHLELIRAIERSFRRANIRIQMSRGFNPRPKISHGPALPVGIGSLAEYMVVDVEDPVAENNLLEKVTSVLPKGLSIYRAKYIEGKQSSIMSAVQSAAYQVEVKFSSGVEDIASLVARFREEDRLPIRHKDKEKWVETNKAILDWQVGRKTGDVYDFYILLSIGDQNSLRPDVAITKLSEMFPRLGRVESLEICRIEQYVNRGNPLINIYNFYEGVKMGSERNK